MYVLISGTVKFYNSERGFGLIRRTDGEKDVRFLIGELKTAGLATLDAGQKVNFEIHSNPETGKVTASVIELA